MSGPTKAPAAGASGVSGTFLLHIRTQASRLREDHAQESQRSQEVPRETSESYTSSLEVTRLAFFLSRSSSSEDTLILFDHLLCARHSARCHLITILEMRKMSLSLRVLK